MPSFTEFTFLPNSASAPAVTQAGGEETGGREKLWCNIRGGGILLNFSFLNHTAIELRLSSWGARFGEQPITVY